MSIQSYSSILGSLEETKKWFSQNNDINERDEDGHTALYELACVAGAELEIAKYLISIGADVNKPVLSHYETPLMAAAYTRRRDLCNLLLANNADVNLVDKKNENVLWRVVWGSIAPYEEHIYENSIIILMELIKKGVNLSQKNFEGKTVLEFCEMRNNQLLKSILEHYMTKIRD